MCVHVAQVSVGEGEQYGHPFRLKSHKVCSVYHETEGVGIALEKVLWCRYCPREGFVRDQVSEMLG